jgi:hypothetical protein
MAAYSLFALLSHIIFLKIGRHLIPTIVTVEPVEALSFQNMVN